MDLKKLCKTKFLTEQGEKNLIAYKYVGSDASLLYKHFFSPVAQFLVDKVIPIWLAPNLITLIGFSCTLLPHLIILAMFPDELAGPVPRWLCIFAAIGQFLYMNLDNADGKQARKTGSSSPLGLLFDHGCDALNTFISGLTLFTIMQLGNTPLAIISDIVAMATFYMATWEEYNNKHLNYLTEAHRYYVEGLHLPIFNGANEGQVGVILFYIFTGIVGTDFWTKSIGPIEANEIAVAIFALMAVVTIVGNITNVRKKNAEKFGNAIFNLITISYIIITMFIVSYCSVTDVISRTARPFIYFIGFSFGKLVGHVQVDHVAHQDFNQFKRSIYLSFTLLNAHTLYGYFSKQPLVSEDAIVYLCLAISLIAYAHFVVNIISEFTRVLRIYVFKIGVKPAGGMAIEFLDTSLIEDVELRGSTDNLDV